MCDKKPFFFLSFGGLLLVIGVSLLLSPAQPVKAQCGSQASSCKSCHEVQGQLPVNSDGTGWHESHAFGDFCYICHAGNPQAVDEAAAHTGMVPPLSDIQAACQQCHADDLTERAQVYATILNVELGSGAGGSGQANLTPAPITNEPSPQITVSAPVAEQPAAVIPADNQLVVDDPNVVDYVQRYNEIVLGERPVNVGNIALVVLIAVVVIGGGGFVIINEIRRSQAFAAARPVEGEYPADIVEMLPTIAQLKYETRKSLRNLLTNPKKTDAVLGLGNTLDPDKKSEESAS